MPTFNDATISERFNSLISEWRALKRYSAEARAFMAANTVSANQVLAVFARVGSVRGLFAAAIGATDVRDYARAQFGGDAFDLDATLNAIITGIDGVIGNIRTTFPNDGTYILKDQLNADGSISVRQLTSAQTAGLRTALSALEGAV